LSENWADISDLAVGCFDVQIWLSGQWTSYSFLWFILFEKF
jgi:hypothetical protein